MTSNLYRLIDSLMVKENSYNWSPPLSEQLQLVSPIIRTATTGLLHYSANTALTATPGLHYEWLPCQFSFCLSVLVWGVGEGVKYEDIFLIVFVKQMYSFDL